MSNLQDSGAYWLGEIPKDWTMLPAWALFAEGKEKCLSDDPHLVPSRVYGVVTRDRLAELSGNKPVDNEASAHHMKHVEPHNFIISMGSHESGIEHSRLVGKVSNDYRVLLPTSGVNPEYYKWFFKSEPLIEGLRGLTTEVRVGQRIHYSRFSLLRLPLPPAEDQQRIADYLDRETAEIDAAVAGLDKYLELLEKRRLETITSAVEGSSGPGKDKLGSEEFFKPKLGYVVIDIRTGLNPRKNFELDTPGAENWYVTVRELDGVSIRTSEATSKINDQALEMIQNRARIKVGDVLFSGTGTIGNTALVSLPPSNWGVKEGIYILTPDTSLMRSDFLLWILRSRKILSLADEMSDGSTIKSIPIEKLKRVPIPLPSLSVQKLIVNYLDRETTEIDALVTESKKLRDLLLKRRSVLITEVITGRKQV